MHKRNQKITGILIVNTIPLLWQSHDSRKRTIMETKRYAFPFIMAASIMETNYYGNPTISEPNHYGNQTLWIHTLLWRQLLWKPTIMAAKLLWNQQNVETKYNESTRYYGTMCIMETNYVADLYEPLHSYFVRLATKLGKPDWRKELCKSWYIQTDDWENVELDWFSMVSKWVRCLDRRKLKNPIQS